jgi:GNAT superfamily N-acetyltransferase
VSASASSSLSAPEPLGPDHEGDSFASGVAALDDWLKRRARSNESAGASRTFVICTGRQIVGYYSLAAGSVSHREAIGKVRRNMPDPVPVVLLGRLAVDRTRQGKGLGADLLADVVLRTLAAAEIIGVRAILAHAISHDAKVFYEKHGFRPSLIEPMTLMINIDEARRMIG